MDNPSFIINKIQELKDEVEALRVNPDPDISYRKKVQELAKYRRKLTRLGKKKLDKHKESQ